MLEVPTGPWADLVSRRKLLALAPLLGGAGFALWTFVPVYPSFALGFVLWGAGGALRSGTLQSLVYEELGRAGRSDAFTRLIGRCSAISTGAVMAASAVAAPVLHAGGYRALGIASVCSTMVASAVGWTFPEPGRPAEKEDGYFQVLRTGLAEVRGTPVLRNTLVLLSVVYGLTALDEYIPLLASGTGLGTSAVPLMVMLITGGMTVGGWCAGHGERWIAPALAVGALCLAAGAVSGRPPGLVLVAVAFGVFQWAITVTEARLQEGITDRARATVTSMSGLGAEVVAVSAYAAYALGSAWAGPGTLFALAAVPYLAIALALRWSGFLTLLRGRGRV